MGDRPRPAGGRGLPAMLLGPVFGAVADRWSRRTVHGRRRPDPRRGLRSASSSWTASCPRCCWRCCAGIGTGCSRRPRSRPSQRGREATPARGQRRSTGRSWTSASSPGPALAALAAPGGRAGDHPGRERRAPSPSRPWSSRRSGSVRRAPRRRPGSRARAGLLRDGARRPGGDGGAARRCAWCWSRRRARSSSAAFFNVAELLFAKEELDVGDVGLLDAGHDLRRRASSPARCAAARAAARPSSSRRYLAGPVPHGGGLHRQRRRADLAIALLVTFLVGGFGNGLMLVYERLLDPGAGARRR